MTIFKDGHLCMCILLACFANTFCVCVMRRAFQIGACVFLPWYLLYADITWMRISTPSVMSLRIRSGAKPARSAYMIQHARGYNTIYIYIYIWGASFLSSTSLQNCSTQITNSLHVAVSFLQYYDAGAMRVSYLSFESRHLALRNKPTTKRSQHGGLAFRPLSMLPG